MEEIEGKLEVKGEDWWAGDLWKGGAERKGEGRQNLVRCPRPVGGFGPCW